MIAGAGMRGGCAAVLVSWVLGGCALADREPAVDPMAGRVGDLEARVARLERVMSGQGLAELARQVEALQAEVRTLRGAVEEQGHAQGGLRQQSRDLYADLDARLQKLEQGGATPAPAAAAAGDQEAYDAALAMLRAGRYADAERAFREFGERFPASGLADNARYWRGETLYVQREFVAALPVFQSVAKSEPPSRKAADAMLKAGYCQYELKNTDAARETLRALIARHPGSDAAREATLRLERWDAAPPP